MNYYDPRQWEFIADMNQSGSVTISDVWLWFKWLYFYPGDFLIGIIVNKAPSVAQFLEITYYDYGGLFSGITSFLIWCLFMVLLAAIFD